MKRFFDIFLSLSLMIIFLIPMIIIGIIIKLTSHGPILFWSKRIGINNTIFLMPKFRTMKIDTPNVATHLLENPEIWITSIGKILRSHSFDELPQLWNILKGDMSFVGPRPALYNQDDLIHLRTEKNIHTLLPGLTGWAQINGRDEIPIPEKVNLEEYYYHNHSFIFDFKILFLTFLKVIKKEGVKH